MRDDPAPEPQLGARASPPAIGLLMLDTRFPRPPGDIGHPATFPFPVLILPGDVIVEAGGRELRFYNPFPVMRSVILSRDPGDTLDLVIQRGDRVGRLGLILIEGLDVGGGLFPVVDGHAGRVLACEAQAKLIGLLHRGAEGSGAFFLLAMHVDVHVDRHVNAELLGLGEVVGHALEDGLGFVGLGVGFLGNGDG